MRRIESDGEGNLYAAGDFAETIQFDPAHILQSADSSDSYVAKLNAAYEVEWVHQASGPSSVRLPQVAVDGGGNVYLAAYFLETVNFGAGTPTFVNSGGRDGFVAKWDSSGGFQWALQFDGGEETLQPRTIDTDAANNVFISGSFGGTVDFDPGAGVVNRTSTQTQNDFLLSLGENGDFRFVHQIEREETGIPRAMRVGPRGNIYLAWDFVGSVVLPNGDTYTNVDADGILIRDFYVLKLNLAAGITVRPSVNLVTTEAGGSASFDIVLDKQPAADVTIDLSSSNAAEGTATPGSLTFTPLNWNVPQTVTVTGVDDSSLDGDVTYSILTASATSSDPDYDGLNAADVSVTNVDDDQPIVLFADSFENGQWNGLWVEDSQNDWFTSSQRASDGNYAAEVDGRATDATLTLADPLDLTPYASVVLSFSWYIESGFDSGEYLALDVFNGTWHYDVAILRGNIDQENTWHHETLELDASYLTNDFAFRFRSLVSRSNEDANVDNVSLIATSLSGPPNQVPFADAGGAYFGNEGAAVLLDASASTDADGTISGYAWSFGDGNVGSGVQPNHIYADDGVYTVTLTVTDDAGGTAVDTATVTIGNVAPTADAGGDYAGSEGTALTFAAAASDPGTDVLTYEWDFDYDGSTFAIDVSGVDLTSPSYTYPDDGAYVVALRVSDGDGGSSFDTAAVSIANVAPTANVGGPYAGNVDEAVTLDAGGSFDPGNDIASYAWDLDEDGVYDDGAGVTTTFTATTGGTFAVSVRVTDDDGDFTTATTTVEIAEPVSGPNLHHGVVSGVGSAGWTTVTLNHSYATMVVVATANYEASDAPGVVRIQNAGGSSFDVRVDPAGGASLSDVSVHYVVAEAGVYTVAEHGVKLEARTLLSNQTAENNNWNAYQDVGYLQAYSSPVVLGQVMTYNDSDWSVFWAQGSSRSAPPSSSTLRVGKHVGEDADTTRANETIGLIVIEQGSGTVGGQEFTAAVGGDSIRGITNSPPFNYSLSGVATPSTAIASQVAMDGNNGGWAMLYGQDPLANGSLSLAIDEDQSYDSERSHTTEQVAYLVFGTPSEAPAMTPATQPSYVTPAKASGQQDRGATTVVRDWAFDPERPDWSPAFVPGTRRPLDALTDDREHLRETDETESRSVDLALEATFANREPQRGRHALRSLEL